MVKHGKDELGWCLLCSSKINFNQNPEKEIGILSRSLDNVFLVKELLQVPSIHLVSSLKQLGDPSTWINLCEKCDQIAKEAIEIQFQIQKLEKKKMDLRDLLVQKVKSSNPDIKTNIGKKFDKVKFQLDNKLRNYIRSHSYDCNLDDIRQTNLNGDKNAKALATGKILGLVHDLPTTPTDIAAEKITIKVRVDSQQELDNKDDNEKDDDEENQTLLTPRRMRRPKPRNNTTKNTMKSSKSANDNTLNGASKKKKTRVLGCRMCDEEFDKLKDRNNHEKSMHSGTTGLHVCEICGAGRTSFENLLQHKRRVHMLRPNGTTIVATTKIKAVKKTVEICEICGTEVAFLRNHIRQVHERRETDVCKLCGIKVWGKAAYKIHLLRKHPEDQETKQMAQDGVSIIRCSVSGCKSRFLKKESCDLHMKKVHPSGNTARFTCPDCGKCFFYATLLKKHVKRHSMD